MKIKKDGLIIYNSIDNTGSTDDASLGARYAKGRLDSTDNNLHHNYYTKEEVQHLISGMGRTKIVPTLYENWFEYVPDEKTTDKEIYYQVNNDTTVATPTVDDLPTYYRMWYVEGAEVINVDYFITCAQDTEIIEGQTYHMLVFSGPGAKSTLFKNYVRAKIEIEPNTYYFVGNDTIGYLLYYYDANLVEAKLGDFEIDFDQYAIKTRGIGSHTLENDITAQNIQDDIKDLTTTLTNKTIDADENTVENLEVHNFKDGVVKTVMPETPVDTELLSAKAIDEAKQDKLTAGSEITTVEDTTKVSQIDLTNKKSFPISAVNIWNYIRDKIAGSASTAITDNLTRSRVIVTDADSKFNVSGVYSAELEQLSGIDTTKSVQTQLNAKQDGLSYSDEITVVDDDTAFSVVNLYTKKVATILGSTIWNYIKDKFIGGTFDNSKAVVTDSNGKLVTSAATSTEVDYLAGTTSKIQTQIDAKQKKDWTYVGILSASRGSAITVGDDWDELDIIIRVTEGSSNFNITNIKTKNDFTQGNPTEKATFVGFNWSDYFRYVARMGLTGSGTNRKLTLNWTDSTGWAANGFYIYKR